MIRNVSANFKIALQPAQLQVYADTANIKN